MFSIFFRGCHPLEAAGYQKLFHISDNGYVLILDISELLQSSTKELLVDELELHHFIKSLFPSRNCLVGPLFINRICLLFTYDTPIPEQNHKNESINHAKILIENINRRFAISASIGIGSSQNINAIYTSFIDALTSLYFRFTNQINYYRDVKHNDQNFDYLLTEQHLLDAIRLRKTDAYDYFGLLLDFIRPLNDETKRNKIVEVLVLSNHAMGIDSQSEMKFINYCGYFQDFMNLKGDELIEFAYRSFIYVTSYVKAQNNIDYSNHIVKATKEYLENHYTEDISLEDVAEQVNISPQNFSKLIKKTTGFNFIDWLSMLRVKKAKELLTNSNLTVKEVCFMVGYKDPNYFSRIFKKRIGITPSEYVKTSSYFNNKS
jgi:two-component system response regulator YesN